MDQCSPFNWVFYNEEEGMVGELKQYILQSRMEVESIIVAAHDEIMKKNEELIHLKDVLMLTIKDRDEAQSKLQQLMLENQLLQRQLPPSPPPSPPPPPPLPLPRQISDNNTSSESDESSIISSPCGGATTSRALQPPQIAATLGGNRRPLPEKGKLLKAVMEAGPLLQTLLVAGPLPQWRQPPPQLDSIEIPPVTINPSSSPRKRGVDHSLDCFIVSSPKYQRVV